MTEDNFVNNPNLMDSSDDILYHFGMTKSTHDLPRLFGDVKFVCCGGTKGRMAKLAAYLEDQLREELCLEKGVSSRNYSENERYSMHKVGPVLCLSHGVGAPSLSVALVELFKLLHHAKCTDVQFFRIGTSGGIGLEPGTVVVANGAVNGLLETCYRQCVLGQVIKRPAPLDQTLSQSIFALKTNFEFPVATGLTMCCDEFYEGQGRLDGAFCEYTEKQKMSFLKECADLGIRNFEMESTCFASMCHRANIKAAIVCVTLVNRLIGDQLITPKDTLHQWEKRPIQLVTRYIKNNLKLK